MLLTHTVRLSHTFQLKWLWLALTVQKAQINWHFQKIHEVEISNHIFVQAFSNVIARFVCNGKKSWKLNIVHYD